MKHLTTSEKIEFCILAARRPCPEIVERREHKAANGRWYTVTGGFPLGVEMTGETRTYYAYFDGRATYGKRFETRETAARAWELNQEEKDQEFHAALLDMTNAQIDGQFEYWSKR